MPTLDTGAPFETSLGGDTFVRLLTSAAQAGFEVRVWYVGLETP